MNTRLPRFPLTREHGSWAVLIVPLIVGTGVSPRVGWEHALLFVTALFAFLCYVPVETLIHHKAGRHVEQARLAASQFWAVVCLSVATAGAGILVARGFVFVLTAGALGILAFAGHALMTRANPKSFGGDLFAVAGLSLGAPAGYAIGTGGLAAAGIVLWLEMVLFFGCTVVYVHMKINANSGGKKVLTPRERFAVGRITLLYHLVVVAVVVAIVEHQLTPPMALAAYVPMFVHAVAGTVRLAARVRFRRLGYLLLAHSVAFAGLMIWALRDAV